MWRLAMRIYEWLSARPAAKWWILSATLLLLTLPLINLQYKENIAEFIPQSGNYLERMEVFQQMSSADKTFVLFSIKNEAQEQNAPLLAEAVDLFAERLAAADSSHLVKEIVKEVDYERYKALIPFIYSHIPYLLSAEDIAKTDSLLSTPGFIEERLMERSAELMLPTGSFLSSSFEWDPLGLFSSVAETQLSTSSIPNCALYNGHIFTPDWRYALCIIASEGDPNESSTNKRLINLIEQAAKIDGITAEHIGAPSIAVGNATRIKRDSILALSLALLLITILLHFTLKSLRDLLLIVATLAFGWLCGISAVALAEQSVSMIVVGIASIILGIAANYPLHLITHTYHCRGRVGESLRQVVSPLITGNITTVGAFCALIPLNSPALRDLGIFAAAMLVGTILFTIVILPHLIKHKASPSAPDTGATEASAPQTCAPDASAPYSSAPNASTPASGITAACRRANVWKRAQTPLIIAATLATLVLGYFGASTRFNPNLQEINYMTQRQRELMKQLSSLADLPSGRETLYIYNSNAAEEPAGEPAEEPAGTPAREAAAVPAQMAADTNESLLQGAESIYEALIGIPELRNAGAEVSSIAQIVPSKRSQQQRLEAWGRLMERHRQTLAERLPKAAESAGFAGNAFSNFFSVIEKEYEIIEPTSFAQLLAGRGASMFKEGERCVTTVTLPQEGSDSLQSLISSKVAGLFEGSGQRVSLFNVKELSSAISESLSADFNYIGLSCSLIVFIFLWLSLRRLSYAIIAFMPMVVSWIWILGIMNLFGIEFNLVNIILATFIFGQGDDYSIFITEGLIYEDKYGKKIIGSFRESIYISAAIMFIGMGTLIVAKHPALSSLGEITVLGMAAVVLFSCTLPPLLFRLFRRVGIIRSAGIVKGV
ncbi:MAG: MMPL family transporter [bacterium]|nr:MMPL family transporter [bacterium]MDY2650336.1 MMPL family transporter [Candidatus Egerieousia sp.]